MNNFIEVRDVVKQYDGHLALNHVSLTVPEGCIYGLLGPNGAGKTSLIRILNLITRADSGEVLIEGKPIVASDVERIGYLPEERGLYKKMKVADQIMYLARLKGMAKADAAQAIDAWLERFELTEWRNKKVEELSKGMAQKVQFIATVIHRPKLLIFDEPFSGFDPVNADMLKREILRLRDEGSTIIFSTHNMSSVEEVCEEITLINHAEVVLQGDVNDIRRFYKKNIIEVELDGGVLGMTPDLYTIEQMTSLRTGGVQAQIRLKPGVTMRQVIAYLNDNYELVGCRELLPTMHDVFVEAVTGKSVIDE